MKQSINIGKYTLESLTSGMYSSPLDLYREYVQNAVDSIDLAKKDGIIKPEKEVVKITIDKTNRNILIYDNGCGVKKEEIVETLLDIGNSKKRNDGSRGFRGIGRLAGLGYCDMLIFTTSYFGEMVKTTISFDAHKLKSLLIPGNNGGESIEDVLNKVVTISNSAEKHIEHYFKVELINVDEVDGLLDADYAREYLIQNLPLEFSEPFVWGRYLLKRIEMEGCEIPSYNIILSDTVNEIRLKKPYEDKFVSDRIKKIMDDIKSIEIKKISFNDNDLAAVMWYATSNYNGTILDDKIKGLRIRKGNIMIGDKTTCNNFFKEERFNGWLIGEIHVFDERLIPNSRRDSFECNEFESEFSNKIKIIADEISKNIRKMSYQRSLLKEKIDVLNEEKYDETTIKYEIDTFENNIDNSSLELDDSEEIAQIDYLNKLSTLINKKNLTKYAILNINNKMTIEQKRILERVFDLILNELNDNNARKLVEAIATKF